MVKRKERSEISEDPIPKGGDDYDEIRREEEKEKGGFFACYLLTSLSPRHKGHTYIGFTVNPRRRIRQHNGEMSCGAWRTKRKRPWEMVLCIYGFPTNVSALQFEWAWQHPTESLAVRKAAATFKSLSGIANKIKLAYTMLTLPAWQSLNLTVNFFSTKYTKHYAGCPSLPEHMKVQVCSMDELPCYTGSDHNMHENEDQWDYDRECDEPVSVCQSVEEGLRNKILNNFTDHQKCIEETTHGKNEWVEDIDERRSWDLPISKEDYRQPVCLSNSPVPVLSSSVASTSGALETVGDKDHQKCIEETTHGKNEWVEDIDERRSWDLPISKEDYRQPVCLSNSLVPVLSSSVASASGALETVEDKDMFGLIEESRVELDWLTRKQSLTITAANKDQPPTKPCEVEIIDVLSPSPSYRGKKRRVSIVCPEIIDLTNSPIFV